ncbi:MAG: translation initiation factor IF-2 [Thermoguttaceae bacterium]|nr:translation initiation factor IF-2 [Thermoguttaceae bacterium]
MSIRIYALAKQLKKESRELVEICKKLGLDGKGSPLASLTDEETKVVVDYFEKADGAPARPTAQSFLEETESAPMRKPPVLSPPTGKVPVLRPARTPRLPDLARLKTENVETASEETPVESVVEAPVESAVAPEAPVVAETPVEPVAAPQEPVVAETPVEPVAAPQESVVAETPVEPIVAPQETSVVEATIEPVAAPEKTPVVEAAEEKREDGADVDAKNESKKEDETVSEAAKPVAKPVVEKKQPLRDVIDRRDSQRKPRERDAARRDVKPIDSRPIRPIPPIMAQQDSRMQVLEEMKRPPMITPPHGDRMRVFEQPRKPKKDDAGATPRANAPKPGVTIHLAPLPPQAPKPVKKATKEPAPQKPEMRLPPEVIRAAARGARPLTEHLREQEERRRQNELGAKAKDGKDARKFGDSTARDASRGRDDRKGGDVRKGGFGEPIGGSDFGSSKNRGKGKGGKDRGETEGRADMRNATRRGGNQRFRDDDDAYRPMRSKGNRKEKGAASAVTAPRKGDVVIETPCTVKQFAEATGISVAVVIKKLMELGYMFTLNHSFDAEVAELLVVALDLKATVKKEATLEEQYVDSAFDQVDPEESLKPRAPVVTFLGHVDHGKTSLLDRILHLHVVSGEAGGITQHIRAYRVSTPGGDVTFVDTPGHEAFTEMRARGANCTDVAVLVVAADDGVMPQTEEAISHAKAAGVPIVVALNKMDLPGVNRDKVIQELATNDLMPSEWGGDVEIIETSATTGMGVDDLLETLLTVAELHELKANPDRRATGVVLEASLQAGEGVVCKALVQKGTLKVGDVVLCGSAYGRVRAMTDTLDARKRLKEAGPSVPVSLTGLDVAPAAGSKFVVLEDVSVARQIAEERAKREREVELADVQSHVTLENLFERMNSSKQQTLNVIVRADVRGSIEAIRKEMGKLDHPEVKVKILQASVGGVTEADVYLADASDAIIVGFNVVPDEGARALAEKKKIQVRRYDVIYKLTEDIRAALEGMLKPIEQVKELGRALVQRAFNISRVGTIAGCRVMYGVIERDCRIRVIRDSRIIGDYQLDTLKREKDDVKEVHDGYECGMKLKNFNDVKEGDVLEAYKIEEVARTF